MFVHTVKNNEEALIWFKLKVDEFLPKMLEDNLNEDVKHYIEKYWQELVVLPASSTGRYHHKTENLRPFGLVNHTLRVVWVTKELGIEELGYVAVYDKWKSNTMIRRAVAAAFLHDFGKIKGFDREHAQNSLKMMTPQIDIKTSIEMTPENVQPFEHVLPPDCLMMIKHHMHNWSFVKCVEVWDRVVAYADYIASRPSVHLSELTYLVMEGQQHVLGATGSH